MFASSRAPLIASLAAASCLLGACSRHERSQAAPVTSAAASSTATTSATAAGSALAKAVELGHSAPHAARPAPSSSPALEYAALRPLAGQRSNRNPTLTVAATGYSSGLRLESGLVLFCDKRGGMAIDLGSRAVSAHDHACAQPDVRNGACEDIGLEVTVSTPGLAGYDVVYATGYSSSYRMLGRVHDCVADKGVLAIVTGSEVVTIDVKAERKTLIVEEGGDQVALNADWLAWSDGTQVFVQHR